MTWLHTWTGLLLGWVLFAIFVTGTATYFKAEITQWMQPELRRGDSPVDAAAVAWKSLEERAPESTRWFVGLPDDRATATTAFWQPGTGGKRSGSATFDPVTGEVVTARESRGAEFFYRFHFQLQLPHPWGRYLAGVAAMFMFVALISGVITHRQFFKEFFTFRPGRTSLRSFLDFHNVTAVLALPFYFMISYSALVIFMAMYMPWGREVLTDAQARAAGAVRERGGQSGAEKKAGGVEKKPWVSPAPVGPMLEEVARRWGREHPTVKRMDVTERGTEKMVVTFTRAEAGSVSITQREQLRFNGATGELLPEEKKMGGVATEVHGTLYGLHMARFAGPAMRWTFFLMGLFGSALVATGLVMWTIKRRAKYAKAGRFSFGHGLVERLNIAGIAGLFVAMGAIFWANRLLPVGMDARGDWEVKAFLYTWAAMLAHAVVRPVLAAWREQLWAGAVLFTALPVVDAVTGPFLARAWADGNAAYLGFHVTVLATGAMLAVVAWKVSRIGAGRGRDGERKADAARERKSRPAEEAV
ncbi:peptidase [Nibricoccus aquaticus]|uniref:Peptidase n=2 Tax=Nibricoccus aquaticus TaxID=2576891 RepID=A0A290Q346_9BACT|nr:peptidase [Nibricoccus aquaticus]